MGWPGPLTDIQKLVWIEHLNWRYAPPPTGYEIEPDKERDERWANQIAMAKFRKFG